MKKENATQKEFTGRHMLIIMVMFFGTVIAVNLTMATLARLSWTGLVVDNSYVASQEFNGKLAESREQAARGWAPVLTFAPNEISYRLNGSSGSPIQVKSVDILLRRPAYEAEDEHIRLEPKGNGTFGLTATIREGVWIIESRADFGEAKPYLSSQRVVLKGGVVQ